MSERPVITGVGVAGPEPDAAHPLPGVVRARLARTERVTQLVLAAAGAALADAGLADTTGPPRPRCGVVLGTAFGCFLTNAAYQRGLVERGPAGASPRLFAATVSNAAAGELAIAYRLGGPSVTLSAGAASGLLALGHAADLLAAGRADALVAGGADAVGEDLAAWAADGGFGGGAVPAEAAAVVVLEDAQAARARGARVLATVEGYAAGFEPALGAARADGVVATVAAALAEAGVRAADLAAVAAWDRPRLAALVRAALAEALGDARATLGADGAGDLLAAAAPLGLLSALRAVPPGAAVLALDVCPSGQLAAVVARRGKEDA